MSEAPPQDPSGEPAHLYDAVAAQRDKVLGGFADQRESLTRAVEEQRLAAMPERMRPAAARASAEIVQALQQMIAREVTRQLELAIRTMLANAADKSQEAPPN
ncbi:MAG: hypothetical protein JF588_06510 [Caulobacterales bacterium]|nr:hypothetical protein [Caulobacterales bacterium]